MNHKYFLNSFQNSKGSGDTIMETTSLQYILMKEYDNSVVFHTINDFA